MKRQLSSLQPDYFVAVTDKQFFPKAVEIAAKLRRAGLTANFDYKSMNLSKQLKQASAQNVKKCIIIGQELADKNQLVIKDMASGEQELVENNEFLDRLKS